MGGFEEAASRVAAIDDDREAKENVGTDDEEESEEAGEGGEGEGEIRARDGLGDGGSLAEGDVDDPRDPCGDPSGDGGNSVRGDSGSMFRKDNLDRVVNGWGTEGFLAASVDDVAQVEGRRCAAWLRWGLGRSFSKR
jgi:hypothetical protein